MDLILANAIVTAHERTAELARSAMPDAPTIPDPERPPRRGAEAAGSLRHGVSIALRRLADRLDPHPGHPSLPGSAC